MSNKINELQVLDKDIFPLMGSEYGASDFAQIDLSAKNLDESNLLSERDLESYFADVRNRLKVKWLYGGYLEHRNLYKSSLFGSNDKETRDIHLGIDIWGPAGTPVYCPLEGVVHSLAYNNGILDYGYTLILCHSYDGQDFHTLYGHLGKSIQHKWVEGQEVAAGEMIANFGTMKENGGWIPHLHFQIIIDMEGNYGDYPGVCSAAMLDHYTANCPNPIGLMKYG